MFKDIGGVELTNNNLISGKFVTDLIMAEYDDFVTKFQNPNFREDIADGIDHQLSHLYDEANKMGLA